MFKKHYSSVAFLLLGVSLLIGTSASAEVSYSNNPNAEALKQQIKGLRIQLFQVMKTKVTDLNATYQSQSGLTKQETLAQLRSLISQRKKILQNTISIDSEAVLQGELPQYIRDGLPQEVQEDLEQNINLTGELNIIHIDNKSIEIKS